MEPLKRNEVLQGRTYKVETSCGSLYVTANRNGGEKLFEVFCRMGKAGGCGEAQLEAIGRMVSLLLRSKIDTEVLIKQLVGIQCNKPYSDTALSCADVVARVLQKEVQEGETKDGRSQSRI